MLSQSYASVSDPVPDRVVAAPWLSAISIAFVVSLFSGEFLLRRHKLHSFVPRSQIQYNFTPLVRTHSLLHSGSGTAIAPLHLQSVGNSDCPNSEDKHTSFIQNRSVVSSEPTITSLQAPTLVVSFQALLQFEAPLLI